MVPKSSEQSRSPFREVLPSIYHHVNSLHRIKTTLVPTLSALRLGAFLRSPPAYKQTCTRPDNINLADYDGR